MFRRHVYFDALSEKEIFEVFGGQKWIGNFPRSLSRINSLAVSGFFYPTQALNTLHVLKSEVLNEAYHVREFTVRNAIEYHVW
jgi:hypothetical protein